MSNDPHIISLAKVLGFLTDIGLDPVVAADLKSVHIDPGVVTVIRYRRNEGGKQYIAGDAQATETVTISIDEPQTFAPTVVDEDGREHRMNNR